MGAEATLGKWGTSIKVLERKGGLFMSIITIVFEAI
jgi:hypothetical protein